MDEGAVRRSEPFEEVEKNCKWLRQSVLRHVSI